jgi:hypothetical protein
LWPLPPLSAVVRVFHPQHSAMASFLTLSISPAVAFVMLLPVFSPAKIIKTKLLL